MKRRIHAVASILLAVLLAPPVFADNADKALAAFKAKKDKDVAALVQAMAMNADFAGLDKVREAAPDVFDVKYFPSDFVSGVIFKYVETKASQQEPTPPPAKPVTKNPNKKGTWQYVYWDLQQAYSAWQKSTDPAAQAKLKGQIDDLANQIQVLMQNMPPDQQLQVGMALALIAYAGTGDDTASSTQNAMEALNAQFSRQALDVLQYLFQVGIPFPSTLPKALPLSDWQREVAAFDFYWQTTDPTKKNEFETDSEFAARRAESDRLKNVIETTEISLLLKLTLGTYNSDEGFFPIAVSMAQPLTTDGNPSPRTDYELSVADVRFYVTRKSAPFFKEKTFSSWQANGSIYRSDLTTGFRLKRLQVRTSDGPVTDNLWGFRLSQKLGSADQVMVVIDNCFPSKPLTFLLSDSPTAGTAISESSVTIPVPEDGQYSLVGNGEVPVPLWKGQLVKVKKWLIPTAEVRSPTGDFAMGITEVTQAQYKQVTGTNPSRFQGDALPIEQVSWYEAVKFCNQLSVQDGLSPVYNDKNEADLTANGWRLPTEAEWELAAKGGNPDNTSAYAGSNNIADVAWYGNGGSSLFLVGNSDGKTHPVASKEPNELGLFDMSGNVWEWCSDVVSGSHRASRGGSWYNSAFSVGISNRNNNDPDSRGDYLGFRVIRSQSTE